MSRPRASELLDPLPYFTRLCLCSGCCPSPTMKATFVCFTCRTTQRRVRHGVPAPVCTTCNETMQGIPLAYASAVPRRTNNRAWKLLERSLDRPRHSDPFEGTLRRKKVTNRKARRLRLKRDLYGNPVDYQLRRSPR